MYRRIVLEPPFWNRQWIDISRDRVDYIGAGWEFPCKHVPSPSATIKSTISYNWLLIWADLGSCLAINQYEIWKSFASGVQDTYRNFLVIEANRSWWIMKFRILSGSVTIWQNTWKRVRQKPVLIQEIWQAHSKENHIGTTCRINRNILYS